MAKPVKPESHTRMYHIWASMRARCDNSNAISYPNYGGRGISYDPRWKKYKNFYDDMIIDYADDLSIDRKNNDLGYSRENCKWSTRREQSNNTRRNRYLEHNGKSQTIAQWARDLGIKRSTIAQRYYVYKLPVERCLKV